jgi:glycosyltransferase involved in cell wall biosynthesis
VGALCNEADVLVLPSHAEGLAMSVLEGLSHGLAVIATPVGAHEEVIEPGQSGILIPIGDVNALTGSLLDLMADESLIDRLRVGARRRFLEKFDVRQYVQQLCRVHVDLLSEQGPAVVAAVEPP